MMDKITDWALEHPLAFGILGMALSLLLTGAAFIGACYIVKFIFF